jgi:hypothetical protein
MRSAGERVGPDCLGDARRFALHDCAGRLRRHVTRGESGTASREHHGRPGVGEPADRFRDDVGVVRDDAPLDREALAAKQLLEDVAARVLAHACADAVRDGEDGGVHAGSFVFSTSSICSIVIALSIAFAMS